MHIGTPENIEVTIEITCLVFHWKNQENQNYLWENFCNKVVHSRCSIKYLFNEFVIIQRSKCSECLINRHSVNILLIIWFKIMCKSKPFWKWGRIINKLRFYFNLRIRHYYSLHKFNPHLCFLLHHTCTLDFRIKKGLIHSSWWPQKDMYPLSLKQQTYKEEWVFYNNVSNVGHKMSL